MSEKKTITLTDKAVDFIKNLKSVNNLSDKYYFRISCEGAIGAPFTYNFGFDSNVIQDDIVIQLAEIKLVLDNKSFENMKGSKVDYSDDEGGLLINNPLANYKCSGSCHSK